MIDPKLNDLPDKNPSELKRERNATVSEAKETAPRKGLSINDTVAGRANLSTGARGADVSGVEAGAGAGAGTPYVTPGPRGASPAPNIVPGSRGSGMTPLSDVAADQKPTIHDAEVTAISSESGPTQEEIRTYAYRCWHERGCPQGSPEEDWNRAEEELRAQRQTGKTAAATA